MAPRLTIGRVAGLRGARGAVTVRVVSGDAERWAGIKTVWIGAEATKPGDARPFAIATAHAYRDRLVLELSDVQSAASAAPLVGNSVAVDDADAPALPDGEFWIERLIGLKVLDAALGEIGSVSDVIETGGVDLLQVLDASGREVLVPLARELVRRVDPDGGTIEVELPEGLLELNRERRGTP